MIGLVAFKFQVEEDDSLTTNPSKRNFPVVRIFLKGNHGSVSDFVLHSFMN